MERKLAQFEVKEQVYEVFGEYELREIKGLKSQVYSSVEFGTLHAKIIVDGAGVDYTPEDYRFNGTKFNVEDMIAGMLADMTQVGDAYKVLFIDQGLQKVVDFYLKDVATQVNGKDVPLHILSADLEPFDLLLVTNEFIYYEHNQEIIMLSTADHSIVSNNHFAEVGFWDSVDNINAGEESILWGELPAEGEQSIEDVDAGPVDDLSKESTEHEAENQIIEGVDAAQSEKYYVYATNSMGSTWFLSHKEAKSCTLWNGAPEEMRATFDTKEEALEKAAELDEEYRFSSTRHFIRPVIVEQKEKTEVPKPKRKGR